VHTPRIGVFVCHCGTNIAGTIRVEDVLRFAQSLPYVTLVKDYPYLCSDAGQSLIKESIRKHGLTHVVIAACTPELHQSTFQECVAEAGVDPHCLTVANIREQCSFVHRDARTATEKAKRIVAAAVARAALLEEVPVERISTLPRMLVIGAGIAGIQAALDAAEAGLEVVLVERSPTIGGRMAQLVKTFPTDDCALCILSPRMHEVWHHPRIRVYTLTEVAEVNGSAGCFHVRLKQAPRYVDVNKCVACGICERVCPVEVPSEFDAGMGTRKAIYLPFPQAVPRAFVIDSNACTKCGRCATACPQSAIRFDDRELEWWEEVGAIVVATGVQEIDPRELPEYGYGENPLVVTQLQLARLLDPSGPTRGQLLRPDGKPVRRVIMIQCVGSRDEHRRTYCSVYCCMAALKHASMIKMEHPDVDVLICYTDIRAARKRFEEYYVRAQDLGVRFVRGRVSRVTYDPQREVAIVHVYHTLLDRILELEADLVVLSVAVEPPPSTRRLARLLGIATDRYGFVEEAHPKLRPVETRLEGIYVAGAAAGPCDIQDAVAQGSAAAAKAVAFVRRGYREVPLLVPEVNEDHCSLCLACITACPYSALRIEKERIVVDVLSCRSCGICAATCPSGAIQLTNMTDLLVRDEISAILSTSS